MALGDKILGATPLEFEQDIKPKMRYLVAHTNCLMSAAPLFPAIKFSQYSVTVLPMGVKAPNPVTTTLFNSIKKVFVYYLIS